MTCQAALSSSIIDDILQTHENNPFDLVVTEIFATECMLGVIHKMNVPYVGLTSCGLMPYHFDRVAMPDTPSVSIINYMIKMLRIPEFSFAVHSIDIRWVFGRNEF